MKKIVCLLAILLSSVVYASETVLFESPNCEGTNCQISRELSNFQSVPGSDNFAVLINSTVDVNGQHIQVNQLGIFSKIYGGLDIIKLNPDVSYYFASVPKDASFLLLSAEENPCGLRGINCLTNDDKTKFYAFNSTTAKPVLVGEFSTQVRVKEDKRSGNIYFFEETNHEDSNGYFGTIDVTIVDSKTFKVLKQYSHRLPENTVNFYYFNSTFQYLVERRDSDQEEDQESSDAVIVQSATGESKTITSDSFDVKGYSAISDELILKKTKKRSGSYYSIFNIWNETESKLISIPKNGQMSRGVRLVSDSLLELSIDLDNKTQTQIFNLKTNSVAMTFEGRVKSHFLKDQDIYCTLMEDRDTNLVDCLKFTTQEKTLHAEFKNSQILFTSHYFVVSSDSGETTDVKVFDILQGGKVVLSYELKGVDNIWGIWAEGNKVFAKVEVPSSSDEFDNGKVVLKVFDLN